MAVWSIIDSEKLEGAKRLDPEYYRPAYLRAYSTIRNCGLPVHPLKKFCQRVTDGSHITPNYQDKGIPFLMVRDVLEEDIKFDNNDFITAEFDSRLKHCKPKPGDILLTKVGSVGIAAVVPGDVPDFNIFVSLSILKGIHGISERYLSAYLNSRFGRVQAYRVAKGISQPDLHLEDIREFLIPEPKERFQREIEALLLQAEKQRVAARELYFRAEQMVLNEGGFAKVDLSWSPGYVATSKAACGTNRIDAEHFQPKYARLIQHLEKTGKACKVGDILRGRIEKGVTPEYTEAGVAAVNSQHLGRYLLNYEGVDHTPETYWANNKRAQIRNLDVLIYATGAYIGRTNCYLENVKALAGVDILMARPNPKCNPIYLSVYLNSKLGMMQADQWATGSAQRHLYPETVAEFTVYLPSPSFQEKIAELVTAAYEARAKAKKLLEDAKRKVEELIEKS
jgi:restriction endonuclease S subunit